VKLGGLGGLLGEIKHKKRKIMGSEWKVKVRGWKKRV